MNYKYDLKIKGLVDLQKIARLFPTSGLQLEGIIITDVEVNGTLTDLEKGLYSELPARKPIDNYRRILQKSYVDKMITLMNLGTIVSTPGPIGGNIGSSIKNSDIPSIARGQLKGLQSLINSVISGTADKISKLHLQELSDRIRLAFNPK